MLNAQSQHGYITTCQYDHSQRPLITRLNKRFTTFLKISTLAFMLTPHFAQTHTETNIPLNFKYNVINQSGDRLLVFDNGQDIFIQPLAINDFVAIPPLIANRQGPYFVVKGLCQKMNILLQGHLITIEREQTISSQKNQLSTCNQEQSTLYITANDTTKNTANIATKLKHILPYSRQNIPIIIRETKQQPIYNYLITHGFNPKNIQSIVIPEATNTNHTETNNVSITWLNQLSSNKQKNNHPSNKKMTKTLSQTNTTGDNTEDDKNIKKQENTAHHTAQSIPMTYNQENTRVDTPQTAPLQVQTARVTPTTCQTIEPGQNIRLTLYDLLQPLEKTLTWRFPGDIVIDEQATLCGDRQQRIDHIISLLKLTSEWHNDTLIVRGYQ